MANTRDAIHWWFCGTCYHLTIWWPSRWMPWPLLPFAGMYAYNKTYQDFRDTMEWIRAGRPKDNPNG